MISNHKMLFNCSIETLQAIFEEQSSAKELCGTFVDNLSSKKKYFITEIEPDFLNVRYEARKVDYDLKFYKISDNIIKCEVEGASGLKSLLIITIICFVLGFLLKNDLAIGGAFFLCGILILFALISYYSINQLCSRIKNNYEKNEYFLKLFGIISKTDNSTA